MENKMTSPDGKNFYPNIESLPGAPLPPYEASAPNLPEGGGPVPKNAVAPAVPQVFVVQGQPFGPHPVMSTCPSCQQTQMSTIEYRSNMKTHIIGVLLLISTCCCCIPYLINGCKSAEHHCSNCGAYLGSYN